MVGRIQLDGVAYGVDVVEIAERSCLQPLPGVRPISVSQGRRRDQTVEDLWRRKAGHYLGIML